MRTTPSLCHRRGFSSLRDPKLHSDLCNPHFLIIISLTRSRTRPSVIWSAAALFHSASHSEMLSRWGWQTICLSRPHWASKSKHMHRSKRSGYSLFDCYFWVGTNSGFSGKKGIVHIQNDQYHVHFVLYLRTATGLLWVLQRYRTRMFLVSFCINCELADFYFFIKTEEHGVC